MLDQIDAESVRKRTKLDLSMGGESTSRRKRQHAIVALEDQSEHRSNILNEVMSTSGVPTLVSQDINSLWPGMKKSPSVAFDRDIASIPETKQSSKTKGAHDSDETLQDKKSKPPVTTKQARPIVEKRRSSTALLGAYTNLQKNAANERTLDCSGRIPFNSLIESAINERKWNDNVRDIFAHLDKNGDGALSKDEFVDGYHKLKPDLTIEQLNSIFDQCDVDTNGSLRYVVEGASLRLHQHISTLLALLSMVLSDLTVRLSVLIHIRSLAEFIHMMKLPLMDIAYMIEPSIRDGNGVIQVQASDESYFGENAMKGVSMHQFTQNPALTGASKSQDFSQELYESRIASMQRFVAMAVIFHQMGSQVERFFRRISFGFLGYRYDRTHSIMRIGKAFRAAR